MCRQVVSDVAQRCDACRGIVDVESGSRCTTDAIDFKQHVADVQMGGWNYCVSVGVQATVDCAGGKSGVQRRLGRHVAGKCDKRSGDTWQMCRWAARVCGVSTGVKAAGRVGGASRCRRQLGRHVASDRCWHPTIRQLARHAGAGTWQLSTKSSGGRPMRRRRRDLMGDEREGANGHSDGGGGRPVERSGGRRRRRLVSLTSITIFNIASLRRTFSASLYPFRFSSILGLISSSIRSTLDCPLNYARNYLPHLLPSAFATSSTLTPTSSSSTTSPSSLPPLSVLQSSSPPQSTATLISPPTSPPPSSPTPHSPSPSSTAALATLTPGSWSLTSSGGVQMATPSKLKMVSVPLVALSLPLPLASVVFWGSLVSASSTTHCWLCFEISKVS
ncbi:hypothetical protein Syun_016849 [Stephania yunnanensis]|uniref:Uncharacterized protein n=1 Tax=Stephania yunnanensis TaxID=152371 RepID=A0AAP0J5I7_9MAGN